MELYSFNDPHGNFGDDLNHWIWDGLLPGWREARPDLVLVGVGTLINDLMPRGPTKVVVGAGLGYGKTAPDPDLLAECRFFSVRGPRSAAGLGLPAACGIVDPAVMLPDFAQFQDLRRQGPPIFVPHHRSVGRHDWDALCKKAGIEHVTPGEDAHQVIRRLATAPLVIAESMHAAIIADAFGTPWVPVSVNAHFLPSKWLDWADSLGLTLDIQPLEPRSKWLRATLDRNRRPAAQTAGAGTTAHAARAPGSKSGLRGLARNLLGAHPATKLERALVPGRLRALAQGPGQISDRTRLAEAKARYRAVLAEVADEFGLKPPVQAPSL